MDISFVLKALEILFFIYFQILGWTMVFEMWKVKP